MKCAKFLMGIWGVWVDSYYNEFPYLRNNWFLNLNSLFSVLSAAEEIKELWEEYENNSTVEAKLVKDFDKVCVFWYFKCISKFYLFS